MPSAMFPPNSVGMNGGDDDDFGDFVFSSTTSIHSPSLFPYPAQALRQHAAAVVDEGWTDFLASPLESQTLQPHSSLASSSPFDPFTGMSLLHSFPLEPSQLIGKGWEKPKGAFPLSFFGEEDAEELEPLEHLGGFENGFASQSISSLSSPRPAHAGKLNDILEILYNQVVPGVEQYDDFDDESWEFKGAFSSYSKPKLPDEGGGAIFGLETGASANGNVSNQVDVSRIENGWKDKDKSKRNNRESITDDLFASHEELTDRSPGYNYSVADNFVHEILPGLRNGTTSSATNGFKLEIPKNAITKKIQADQAESPERKKGEVVQWNMRESVDLSLFASANGSNTYGSSEDNIEPNTGTKKMVDQPVALTSIIQNLYENADGPHATRPSQSPSDNIPEIDEHGGPSSYVSGDVEFDHFEWEFQNAVGTADAENSVSHASEQTLSTSYSLVELYCRLKEESLSLIVHHLAVLKVPALPGATSEVKNINMKIQEVHGNLLEMMASEDACTGKKTACHIDQLLNVTITSEFKAVEHEYSLSERLLVAEKDLNAAMELFIHSSSVLHILRLASKDQQLLYINAWSKLASACAQELQLGARILTKSLDGNISKQLLVKGNKYFIALGEIFRLSKILKTTVKVYMPWLLSNLEDSSEIVTCLEMGNEAWISSGLEEALQTISNDRDLDDRDLTKPLLESINLIDRVIGPTYQDPVFHKQHGVCKFYLLPLDKLPELNTVMWNGNCYITKFANFWASRISPDPPELPSIFPS